MNADSIKSKIRNLAKHKNINTQQALTTYMIECFLNRLSYSNATENLLLKGGVLMYALLQDDFTRGTIDIDLMVHQMRISHEKLVEYFTEILKIELNDGVVFDLSSIQLKAIQHQKKYPGYRVQAIGNIEKTKLYLSLDLSIDDVIYPQVQILEYPSLFQQNKIRLYASSKESIISEKLHGIVLFGKANSRVKDFYDIFLLSSHFSFLACDLKKAIQLTFNHRNTKLQAGEILDLRIFNDAGFELKWRNYAKIKGIIAPFTFSEMVYGISLFINPIFMNSVEVEHYHWNPETREWHL